MLIDPYVSDKLRELEAELARRRSGPQNPAPRPVVGALAGAAGRALRRMGEGLESWANPSAQEGEAALVLATRQSLHYSSESLRDPARTRRRWRTPFR